MNSKNSGTSNPHRLLLNLSEKINLKKSEKYVVVINILDQTLAFTMHGQM